MENRAGVGAPMGEIWGASGWDLGSNGQGGGGGRGGVPDPSFGINCETDPESGGGV